MDERVESGGGGAGSAPGADAGREAGAVGAVVVERGSSGEGLGVRREGDGVGDGGPWDGRGERRCGGLVGVEGEAESSAVVVREREPMRRSSSFSRDDRSGSEPW